MNNKSLFLSSILTILCFFGSSSSVFGATTTQNPLDSLKQVLRTLSIPYDIQEEWVEGLEDLEDEQNSSTFRELLLTVNKEIERYLADKENYTPQSSQKRSKKRKLKDRLDRIGKQVSKTVNQGVKSTEITINLEKAKDAERKEEFPEAIHYYKKAVEGLANQEKWKTWAKTQENIADIMASKLKDFDGALAILPDVKEKLRTLGDGQGMRRIDTKINNLHKNLDITVAKEAPPVILDRPTTSTSKVNPATTPVPPVPPVTPDLSAINAQIKKREADYAKQQAAIAERRKREAEAAVRIREAERAGINSRELAALRKEKRSLEKARIDDEQKANKLKEELMEQKLALAEQESEINKAALAQRNLYGGLAILGLLLFSTFFMYRSKKKDHKKLAVAYGELEQAQEELKVAEQKIKGLLDQHVSGAVATALLSEEGKGGMKHERRFVCVLFLDIRNFTPFVESKTPEEIIEYQNNVLGFMMEKIIEHGGIVNTVLGDGFMATFGAPVSAGNDCLQAYKAAVEIMQMVREKSRTGQIPPTKIGIGMHAGNVVAGNVGTKTRKQYSITGNTVIVASRLEQLNKQYGSSLIISKEVVERLPKAMNLPKVFDEVMVKGRSKPVQIAKYG